MRIGDSDKEKFTAFFHNSEKSAKFATLFKFDKKLTNTFK